MVCLTKAQLVADLYQHNQDIEACLSAYFTAFDTVTLADIEREIRVLQQEKTALEDALKALKVGGLQFPCTLSLGLS